MGNALVVGSSGGIGRAICIELLKHGWSVFGIDIKERGELPEGLSSGYTHFVTDITSTEQLQQLRPKINNKAERINAVIYAAGVYDHFPLVEGDATRFDRILKINTTGPLIVVSEFFEFLHSGKSRVVVISSETAMVSLPFQVYGTSKRMLENALQSLRQELAIINIPVITIRPGAHETYLFNESRELLGRIDSDSRFKRQLEVVRDRGQEIIDRGAADTSDIARVVLRSINARRPRRVYHVNVAARFRIMALLPLGFREWILRRVLR